MGPGDRPVKLITLIVKDDDAGRLINALVAGGLRATRLRSSGGFLRARNATIILGVTDEQLPEALRIVRATCRTRRRTVEPMPAVVEHVEIVGGSTVEVDVGGATIFVTDVVHYEQI